MLELRPSCEHCNVPLPADSTAAMICSFECTFCRDCVERLHNVCPNCGGGFVPRPVRPAAMLAKHPASTLVTHRPVDLRAHAERSRSLRDLPPERR
jgi:hypothetical protein